VRPLRKRVQSESSREVKKRPRCRVYKDAACEALVVEGIYDLSRRAPIFVRISFLEGASRRKTWCLREGSGEARHSFGGS